MHLKDKAKGAKFIYHQVVSSTVFTIKANSKFFMQFATGQLLLQAFNLINGFFLLRWLSIAEQAKFSIALSIQTFIIALSDLGFTGSIIALVGDRIHDKKVVKAYIQSAKRLRNFLFLISCVLTLVLLPVIIRKQSWSYLELTLLLTPVLLSVYWQANCSLYDSTLVMHRKMNLLYGPQVAISASRLTINFLLHITNTVSAFTTLLLNAISTLITGRYFKRKALPYIDVSIDKFESELREMIYYLKPLFPSLVFNAFYGQIQIFLISFFGKTANIAEVAALGKIAQLFLFLASFNGVLIAPFIAKALPSQLKKRYFIIITLTILLSICIIVSSYLIPAFYLYLLGPKYIHLRTELNLLIINSCLSLIGNVMWTMHSARKWVYWWGTWSYIICVTACQIIGIVFFDLSTTHGVLAVSTLTFGCLLFVHLQNALVGFYNQRLSTKKVIKGL